MNETYVLDLPTLRWTTFTGIRTVAGCVMSGGSTLENVNLLMDSAGNLFKYPDDTNADKVATASIKKEIEFFYSTFRNVTLKHTDDSVGLSGTINVIAKNNVIDFELDKTITITDDILKRYGLPLGAYGNRLEITISNIDKIENILLYYNERASRG